MWELHITAEIAGVHVEPCFLVPDLGVEPDGLVCRIIHECPPFVVCGGIQRGLHQEGDPHEHVVHPGREFDRRRPGVDPVSGQADLLVPGVFQHPGDIINIGIAVREGGLFAQPVDERESRGEGEIEKRRVDEEMVRRVDIVQVFDLVTDKRCALDVVVAEPGGVVVVFLFARHFGEALHRPCDSAVVIVPLVVCSPWKRIDHCSKNLDFWNCPGDRPIRPLIHFAEKKLRFRRVNRIEPGADAPVGRIFERPDHQPVCEFRHPGIDMPEVIQADFRCRGILRDDRALEAGRLKINRPLVALRLGFDQQCVFPLPEADLKRSRHFNAPLIKDEVRFAVARRLINNLAVQPHFASIVVLDLDRYCHGIGGGELSQCIGNGRLFKAEGSAKIDKLHSAGCFVAERTVHRSHLEAVFERGVANEFVADGLNDFECGGHKNIGCGGIRRFRRRERTRRSVHL